MKKSDLFKKFEIEKREYPIIIGGFTTSTDSDTTISGSENNDVVYDTKDANGGSLGCDSIETRGDLDQPALTIAS